MQFKKYTKQRLGGIQGLRSFKDTLPTKVKKIINKKGSIFPEILNNWKYIVGKELFDICYPNRFKSSNKVRGSTLEIMVNRGSEVDVEYSKKQILNKLNSIFGYVAVNKIKIITFEKNEKIVEENYDNVEGNFNAANLTTKGYKSIQDPGDFVRNNKSDNARGDFTDLPSAERLTIDAYEIPSIVIEPLEAIYGEISLFNFIRALFLFKAPEIRYPSSSSIALLPKLCPPILISLLHKKSPSESVLTTYILEFGRKLVSPICRKTPS